MSVLPSSTIKDQPCILPYALQHFRTEWSVISRGYISVKKIMFVFVTNKFPNFAVQINH